MHLQLDKMVPAILCLIVSPRQYLAEAPSAQATVEGRPFPRDRRVCSLISHLLLAFIQRKTDNPPRRLLWTPRNVILSGSGHSLHLSPFSTSCFSSTMLLAADTPSALPSDQLS